MSDMNYRVSVAEIQQSPYYRNIVDKVASLSPVVPPFDHKGQSNIETIKFKLAQREMHDLVMQILKGM